MAQRGIYGSAMALEPKSWNTSRLWGSGALLVSPAVAHRPFAFPPYPKFQETEKRVFAQGLKKRVLALVGVMIDGGEGDFRG